jgi:aspartate aminotransferase
MLPASAVAEAQASARISEFFSLKVRLQAEGRQPIDLTLGNPLEKPPPYFYDSLAQLVEELRLEPGNPHRYMEIQGYPEVRERVAEYFSKRAGHTYQRQDIWLTAGCASGIDITFASLLSPGDEVLIPSPFFMEYDRYIRQNQGVTRPVPTSADWGLDLARLDAACGERSRVLLLNYPNNPTGRSLQPAELQELLAWLQGQARLGRILTVVEDSPYDQVSFAGPVPTLSSLWPHSIYLTSLSKSHGLAGERIGYLALHPQWGNPLCGDPPRGGGGSQRATLATILTNRLRCRVINAPALQQRMLGRIGPQACVDLSALESRIRLLESALLEAGFWLRPVDGGFFVFARLPEGWDEARMNQWAFDDPEPLLSVPGPFFGGEAYTSFLRFSATVEDHEMQRACRRLARFPK